MFREMRRKGQALPREACEAVLRRQTAGVLATAGDDGYPYAVPLSYAYGDGRIYIHGAGEGHKLDAIARSDKVSFCVIDQDDVVPEKYTTNYRSVIAFGRARVLRDVEEKRHALEKIAARYSPDQLDALMHAPNIDQQLARVCLVEIAIEHMTGKEAVEKYQAGKHAVVSPQA